MDVQPSVFIAIDLGAGSGRVIAVIHDASCLSLDEVHRFESPAVDRDGGMFWDIDLIWSEIKSGLREAALKYDAGTISSIGVDSWGVDYGWMGGNQELLQSPYCYRDPRTDGLMDEVERSLGKSTIFEETGIQFMPINTLYQLRADLKQNAELPKDADCFLMIADMINHLLTGRMVCERTNASTTQLYNPRTLDWSYTLARGIGLSAAVMPEIIDPGTELGMLRSEIAAEAGLAQIPVIAVGSHDTASAVAGVPAGKSRFAYLSCGTWALLGTELVEPLISKEAMDLNFTNETGVANTFRLLKNITGLWLVQECRRTWQELDGKPISYDQLAEIASDAPALTAFVDPDAPEFAHGGDLPRAIRDFCERTGQRVPETRGETLRIAVESLALKAAVTLDQLESLTDQPTTVLHVIGGGVRNTLLMQCLANATQRTVVAGPVEATAFGNAIVQMMASGRLNSLAEGRGLLAETIATATFLPKENWLEQRQTFDLLLAKC
ncbi:MAG: rhamnulokinase family protein [Verrucomicrobiales bacterium]